MKKKSLADTVTAGTNFARKVQKSAKLFIDHEEKPSKHGKYVGAISVDSGLCWLGDPGDVIHSGKKLPKSFGKDWFEFCSRMTKFKMVPTKLKSGKVLKLPADVPIPSVQFDADNNLPMGVCVQTGHGDGFYPVFIKMTRPGKGKSARVKSVTVEFIE